MSHVDQIITTSYFAFTTLTTVGFGDLHARSDFERLSMAFIFISGVLIFSIIMSNFSEILRKVEELNSDLEKGDDLTRFFGLLKKFNGGKSINHELISKFEKFFDYKWNNDKLMALDNYNEISLLQ